MDTTTARMADLRQMLTTRRAVMQADVDVRLRGGRADRSNEVRDIVDLCDVGIEEELSFALLQMSSETLTRIDAALGRLEVGKYGRCFECDAEISEVRLRALPFAVRCTGCEQQLEHSRSRDRQDGLAKGSLPLFPEFLRA